MYRKNRPPQINDANIIPAQNPALSKSPINSQDERVKESKNKMNR